MVASVVGSADGRQTPPCKSCFFNIFCFFHVVASGGAPRFFSQWLGLMHAAGFSNLESTFSRPRSCHVRNRDKQEAL